jgi:hypothetical protein
VITFSFFAVAVGGPNRLAVSIAAAANKHPALEKKQFIRIS